MQYLPVALKKLGIPRSGHRVTSGGYIVMAYIVMTCMFMAYIFMACMLLALIVMAYIVMAYIVEAYVVIAAAIALQVWAHHTSRCQGHDYVVFRSTIIPETLTTSKTFQKKMGSAPASAGARACGSSFSCPVLL